MEAIREACKKRGSPHLPGCVVYTSAQVGAGCAGRQLPRRARGWALGPGAPRAGHSSLRCARWASAGACCAAAGPGVPVRLLLPPVWCSRSACQAAALARLGRAGRGSPAPRSQAAASAPAAGSGCMLRVDTLPLGPPPHPPPATHTHTPTPLTTPAALPNVLHGLHVGPHRACLLWCHV